MAPVLPTPEELAKFFHEKYERLALEMGYETRAESRRAWEDVPEKNRALMIATAGEVLSWLGYGLDQAMLEADPETAAHPMDESETNVVRAQDSKCSVCRGEKRMEVTRDVEDSGGVLVIGGEVTVEELGYKPKPNERIRIFCSRCGLVYHEDSIR